MLSESYNSTLRANNYLLLDYGPPLEGIGSLR